MKIDTYTKVVLTVIAAALLWICVENTIFPHSALAQSQPQRVVLVRPDGTPLRIDSGRLAVSGSVSVTPSVTPQSQNGRYQIYTAVRETASGQELFVYKLNSETGDVGQAFCITCRQN
jgi:hypothetical protein